MSDGREYLKAFAEVYFHDPAIALLRASEARLVERAKLAGLVLDLGSGDGSFLDVLQPSADVIALDLSPLVLAGWSGRSGCVGGVAGRAGSLPFATGSFACVLANSSLEHMLALEDVLKETRRVLCDGGKLVMSVHNRRFASRMWFWSELFRRLGLGSVERRGGDDVHRTRARGLRHRVLA